MIILGIESSCDETAAAVYDVDDNKRILKSNIVSSQIDTHALFGGVVPEIASRAHIEAVDKVVKEAIKSAGITLDKLDAIGVTFSPGLIGSLLVGVSYAKSLAYALNIPLVPVNHIKGHLAAAYIENIQLNAPFLGVVISGGHTSIYDVKTPIELIEIGSTRDDAAGEAFDKVGRVMGMPYPGGAAMDRYAQKGFEKNVDYISFPSPAINDNTLDFSFSGLKTAVINTINTKKQYLHLEDSKLLPEEFKEQVAASFTKVIVEGICKKLKEAIIETNHKDIVVAGGVAANSHIRNGLNKLAKEMKCNLYMPSIKYCGDNGAMIAAQAYFEYKNNIFANTSLNAYASDEAGLKVFPL